MKIPKKHIIPFLNGISAMLFAFIAYVNFMIDHDISGLIFIWALILTMINIYSSRDSN
jgi:hypothetical protein